ncbi:MAG: transglutaminase-like cysteine peptidase [Candidatus Sedimenticola sp. (ex Thyasira tokunagai)]
MARTPLIRDRHGRRHLKLLFALLLWSAFAWLAADGLVTEELIQWATEKYGSTAGDRMRGWQRLMEKNQQKDEATKLAVVNDFFNLLTYRSDLNIWGQKDYWATPVEALGKGKADCEDYSIAKYFTLRELGVPDEKMRIMYVKALELNEAHMVLTYYSDPGAVPVVLDNLNRRILSANKRADLAPVYSFNAEGLWLAKNLGRGKKLGSSGRLNRWEDLKARMAKELKP